MYLVLFLICTTTNAAMKEFEDEGYNQYLKKLLIN